ncbi:MAG: RpiB/LacA/LacB family sugar-phosphate isomerase [Clostridiaceae bacterium]|nr:RpiB/LacA/LacB family sugar-phosphate isomerase [Clostridiaceae bacterium]
MAYKDFGTYSQESVDYPKYASSVTESVKPGECERSILCCGTGVGISIATNKVSGIRAAVVGDCFTSKATKEHNNSNTICLGERVTGEGLALMVDDAWLNTELTGEKHQIRLNQIKELEEKYSK